MILEKVVLVYDDSYIEEFDIVSSNELVKHIRFVEGILDNYAIYCGCPSNMNLKSLIDIAHRK